MPKAIVHCGVEEYAIEVDGVRSDPEEYGDPIILVCGNARYIALIEEVDRARTSMLGAAYVLRLGPDVACTFKPYDEEEGEDLEDDDVEEDLEDGEPGEDDEDTEDDPAEEEDDDLEEDLEEESDGDPEPGVTRRVIT